MICPECGYMYGWSNADMDTFEGREGEFYKLPIELKRSVDAYSSLPERADLYGCPKCKKLFLGD
jgi:hypothetical protein